MAIFSVANRTSVATITTAALEIHRPGANNAYSLKELGITQNAATASVFGYAKPCRRQKGVTPANGSTVQAEDQGNTTAGNTTTGTTWATGPTAPTNFWRRVSTPATIGAGIIWTFPRGIKWYCSRRCHHDFVERHRKFASLDVWVVVDEYEAARLRLTKRTAHKIRHHLAACGG